MNGTNLAHGEYVSATLSSGWRFVGAADVDDDNMPEIVLENDSLHKLAFWMLNGATVTGGHYFSTALPTGWRYVAAADVNGDGVNDIVFQGTLSSDHGVHVWFVDSHDNVTGTGTFSTTPPSGWLAAQTGDFDADGKPDFVLENLSLGQAAIWDMNGLTVAGGQYLSNKLPAGWELVGD
jgi:hypothetical protein